MAFKNPCLILFVDFSSYVISINRLGFESFLKKKLPKKQKQRPFPNFNPRSPVKRRGYDMGRANFVPIRAEYIAKGTTNLTTARMKAQSQWITQYLLVTHAKERTSSIL